MMKDREVLDEQITCLEEQGFTTSLARLVCQHVVEVFPLRIWVVDNSGSMNEYDGRRLVDTTTPTDVKWTSCTRWDELKECVHYHAQMAALLQAPTQFHLLNAPQHNLPQRHGVAEMGVDMVEEELHSLQNTLENTTPKGATPLTMHLQQIYSNVAAMAPSLQEEGKKVVIVLATDGRPTDAMGYSGRMVERDFEVALQRLQELPVWIVVRLCTNDENVLQYYQSLDDRLEWNLEVLDDYLDESKEVYGYNPWLNYSLALHRCREMGFHNRLFDLLDERTLSLEETKEFIHLLLGNDEDSRMIPDPQVDWNGFRQQVKELIRRETRQWNPIRRRVGPWIDVRLLDRTYRPFRYYMRMWGRRIFIALALIVVLWIAVDWEDLLDDIVDSSNQLQGILSMALGLVTVTIILGRHPRTLWDKRTVMMASAGIIGYYLWDKPPEFWEGVGWIFLGIVLITAVVLLKLRSM